MAEQRTAKRKAVPGPEGDNEGFSAGERAAMKERVRELKGKSARGKAGAKQDGEADVVAKIAELKEPDRAIAERGPRARQGERPATHAADVVRHARVRPRREDRLLLPGLGEVREPLLHTRFQRLGTVGRWRDVAHCLRGSGTHPGHRSAHRGTDQASSGVTTGRARPPLPLPDDNGARRASRGRGMPRGAALAPAA